MYKTIDEILKNIDNKIKHPKVAEQLQCLALTEFVKQIEKKGAVIISCSPEKIKCNNGEIYDTIGQWIKYTYDKKSIYMIQFDSNPFFQPKGYIEYYTSECRVSTGITELPMMYYYVNEYNSDQKNVKQLVNQIYESEKYLKNLSFIHRDKYISRRDSIEQHIYYF